MESNRDRAIKRIKVLKKQFNPSEDFKREIDSCTFNFDTAYEVVRKLRPSEHYKTIKEVDHIVRWERFAQVPKDELRVKTNRCVKNIMDTLYQKKVFTPEQVITDPDLVNRCLMGVSWFSGELSTKIAVQTGLYAKSLYNIGTEIHSEALMKAAKFEEWGCFCLTELGHGSDVSQLETTAHYDSMTKEFIINSPTPTSRKFWIGNLAITATKAVVFAQLIVNGVRYGIHGLLVQIRDPKTMKSLPGITIGDCGDKLGINGIDNGWALFDKCRVPKTALLNKYADVSPDGVYSSSIKSKAKRMAVQLGSLSGGRLAIAQVSVDQGLYGLSTALRYTAVRKQFKNPNTKIESRILDYRILHHRIIGKFCHQFVQYVGFNKVVEFWNQFKEEGINESKMTNFIHLISSVSKAVLTWDGRDATTEARQACGGLGFSSYNNFGPSMVIIDLNTTWEGDNNILMQQAGKLILQNLAYLFKGKPLMPTFEFLMEDIPDVEPFTESLEDLGNILKLFTYRLVNLIQETGSKLQMAEDKVSEWDRLLAYYVYPMTFTYFNRFLLSEYINWLANFDGDLETKKAFEKVGLIYGQRVLINDAANFTEYLSKSQIDELKDSVMNHLLDMRKDIIAMTYLLPFTDKMYGAVARSEMKPYEYFLDAVNYYQSGGKSRVDDDIILSTSR
ncbi:unnamed protein product [Moneuplotes crassus]|uniref:Acyl-coenzyme A oxidase n=1 Tax=Euplotes crassus TaxID=5936 RepID=A0AAD1X6I5_EUPCR|nr:unnamed protein product [Moneuplotes crassus]